MYAGMPGCRGRAFLEHQPGCEERCAVLLEQLSMASLLGLLHGEEALMQIMGLCSACSLSLATPKEGLIVGCLRDSLWALPIQWEGKTSPWAMFISLLSYGNSVLYSLPRVKIVMNRCVHTDRPFVLSKTRDKIFCRVWHITPWKEKNCVCFWSWLTIFWGWLRACRERR